MIIKLLTSIGGKRDDGSVYSYGYGEILNAASIGAEYAANLCASGQAEEIAGGAKPAEAPAVSTPTPKKASKKKVDVNPEGN